MTDCVSCCEADAMEGHTECETCWDPEPCAALIWHGSRWGETPEPEEFCENAAEPGSEYCINHQGAE